ncbi:MAG TPA: TonB-dependent receptor [Rhizomicrobium sp.]|nr:TonB-dependent receptor [Rhizomicrobium sp.]
MRKILLASVALAASPALADTSFEPETVVVTATRTPQPVEVTGTSVSVITADDIKAQQTEVVTDLLAETPGLTVVRNGGVGQTTSVNIRGAETGQTLALVDGVRINDPSSVDDQAILGDVLVNQVDRIEVLRGPQSTLYGSDAIGGVVDVITKRGGDAPFAAVASAEGGSFDTWYVNAGANGTVSTLEYGLGLNYFDTGGISAADAKNGNPEADGYRNFGATLNTRYKFSEDFSLDLRGYYTQSHTEFDGFPPPFFSFQDDPEFGTASLVAGYAGANLTLMGGHFHNRLAFIASESNRKFFGEFDFFTNAFSPAENFFARGDAQRIEYQGTYDFDDADQLTFGAETQRLSMSTQSLQFDPGPTTGARRTTGYYAQMQSTLFDQLTLTGGVRLEDDDEFGTHTSVKFAGAWNIPGFDTVLRANYGDGFKAPTLYELFSQYKNPFHNLAPETATGWEVGADHFLLDGKLRAALTYFERHTRNQIDFVSTATPPFGYYENLARTRARGIEAEIDGHVSDTLSVSLDYTWLDAKNAVTGLDLARRPRDSASATLTWQPSDGVTLGGSVVYTGQRFDDAGNFRPLDSNTTLNLFGSYRVVGQTELFARMENVTDEDSEPVFGYGRPGRAVYAGVRSSF